MKLFEKFLISACSLFDFNETSVRSGRKVIFTFFKNCFNVLAIPFAEQFDSSALHPSSGFVAVGIKKFLHT
jgi:hypothetical protein